jgi:hypothetical protein
LSTSQTYAPFPWLTQTGVGRELAQLDGTPPGIDFDAWRCISTDLGTLLINIRSSSSIISSSELTVTKFSDREN